MKCKAILWIVLCFTVLAFQVDGILPFRGSHVTIIVPFSFFLMEPAREALQEDDDDLNLFKMKLKFLKHEYKDYRSWFGSRKKTKIDWMKIPICEPLRPG